MSLYVVWIHTLIATANRSNFYFGFSALSQCGDRIYIVSFVIGDDIISYFTLRSENLVYTRFLMDCLN